MQERNQLVSWICLIGRTTGISYARVSHKILKTGRSTEGLAASLCSERIDQFDGLTIYEFRMKSNEG
ncbi:MAG: hypothetical protein ACOVQM_09830, partial [Pirellula sp.]